MSATGPLQGPQGSMSPDPHLSDRRSCIRGSSPRDPSITARSTAPAGWPPFPERHTKDIPHTQKALSPRRAPGLALPSYCLAARPAWLCCPPESASPRSNAGKRRSIPTPSTAPPVVYFPALRTQACQTGRGQSRRPPAPDAASGKVGTSRYSGGTRPASPAYPRLASFAALAALAPTGAPLARLPSRPLAASWCHDRVPGQNLDPAPSALVRVMEMARLSLRRRSQAGDRGFLLPLLARPCESVLPPHALLSFPKCRPPRDPFSPPRRLIHHPHVNAAGAGGTRYLAPDCLASRSFPSSCPLTLEPQPPHRRFGPPRTTERETRRRPWDATTTGPGGASSLP